MINARPLLYVLTVLFLAAPTEAAVVYTYSGNQFQYFSIDGSSSSEIPGNIFSESDQVNVKLVLSDHLPAVSTLTFSGDLLPMFNHNIGSSPITPLSWEISAGSLSFSSSSFSPNSNDLLVDLTTDVQGNIYAWNIRITESNYSPSGTTLNASSVIETFFDAGYQGHDGATSCTGAIACSSPYGSSVGYINGAPGVWSVSVTPVPIPGGIYMLGSSLLLLLRKKLKHS